VILAVINNNIDIVDSKRLLKNVAEQQHTIINYNAKYELEMFLISMSR